MFLGIEIGGTKLQLGLGRGDGEIVRIWRGPVDAAAGGNGIRRQIVAAVPELLAKAGVGKTVLGGIGVGFGGPVDDTTQSVIKSHQISGWEDFPIAQWLTSTFGLPAALGNDADVAGLAEATLGAGKGMSPIFYITIGSGIGGGLIVDRKIYRGCGQGAAEIGHLRIACGSHEPSVLELIASGWAMEQRAAELQLAQRKVPEIFQASKRGDAQAWEVVDLALNALAEAICHVIALLCPKRIVIGGGVSLLGDSLFVPLRHLVAERVFKPFAGLTEIVPAALGEEVVVHGALALARQRFGG